MKKYCTFFLIFFLKIAFSQQEELFLKVRNLAPTQKYAECHFLMDSLIKENPQNQEYRLYKYRLFSWEKKVNEVAKLISDTNVNECFDKYEILYNIYFWTEKYDTALIYLSQLNRFPQDSNQLNLKKATLFFAAEKYKHVVKFIDSIPQKGQELKTLYTLAYLNKSKNEIGISDQSSFYLGTTNYINYLTLTYLQKNKFAPILFQYQFANTNEKSGHQWMLEVLPKLSKKSNLDLLFGISTKQMHPFITAGLGGNFYFKNGYDLMIGYKLFHVSSLENANLLNVGVSKSFSQNVIHLRASFIYQQHLAMGYVGTFFYKRFVDKSQMSYLQFTATIGRITNPIFIGLSAFPHSSLVFTQDYQCAWQQYIYKGFLIKTTLEFEYDKRINSEVKIRKLAGTLGFTYKF